MAKAYFNALQTIPWAMIIFVLLYYSLCTTVKWINGCIYVKNSLTPMAILKLQICILTTLNPLTDNSWQNKLLVLQSLNRVWSRDPHRLQHAMLSHSSLSPEVCSKSCPLSWWCHPITSSSFTHLSFCLQSFPAWRSFPMSWLCRIVPKPSSKCRISRCILAKAMCLI